MCWRTSPATRTCISWRCACSKRTRRALFASYLVKLGDPRALPVLIAAANEENCRYMDFIELRAAIEELGGEAPEREFYDDPEYEALHPMDDGDDDTNLQ